MIRLIAAPLLLIAVYAVQGQSLPGLPLSDLPNLPPSIRWQKIKSPHFKIIYPQYLEKEAQRTANILEHIYAPASESIAALPNSIIKRFPILLQSEHAESNGFVTIGPYRSEFFMFSPQNYRSLGNDEWLAHLALHEYRHIAQFKKATTPLSMLFFLLAGEAGIGGISKWMVPDWFFEGDAVGIETAMGHTGRGRTPSFLMAYKANLIEKGGFNYDKQHLGSFRDFVPSHYVTGYLMTTYVKNTHGVNIWDPIIGRVFKNFTPFPSAMKMYTGKAMLPTYKAMQHQQKALYTEQLSKITPTPFHTLAHRPNKRYTDYLLPQEVFDSHVLAVKRGFADIPQFVLLDQKGKETKLHPLGFWNNSGVLSATDTLVVWAEQTLDSRWQRRTYSVLKTLNLKTRKLMRLTQKTKYVSPALSPDSKHIVAIHQSPLGQCKIHWLDAQSGEVVKMFDNPTNAYYAMPSVSPDGKSIICLKQKDKGKAIVKINIATEKEQELYHSDTENLGSPLLHDDKLYYATDANGIDNIYALDLASGQRYQVTSSKYGAFAPALSRSGGELIYNEYTADGFRIASATINPSAWTKAEAAPYVGTDFQKKMVESEHKEDLLYHYPDSTYRTKRYHKFPHSIRPHSWSVLPFNNGATFNLTTNDLLGTTQITLGSVYNHTEGTWRGSANVSYQAWYPILDIGYEFGRRTVYAVRPKDEKKMARLNWDEKTLKLGARVPFYLTNSAYLRKISLGASYNYSWVNDYTHAVEAGSLPAKSTILKRLNRTGFTTLNYTASFSRLLRQSKLDLNPRWGQTLTLSYRHTILEPKGPQYLVDYFSTRSERFALSSNLLFPGLFPHHSLHLQGAYQYQKAKDYYFLSAIPFARGSRYHAYEHLTTLSINYALPLAYMDWHLGPILNLQRIYANAFYDLTIGKNPTQSARNFQSLGVDAWFDVNLFRLLPLLRVGFRYSYIPEASSGSLQLLLGNVTF